MSVAVFPRHSFPEDEKKHPWLPILLDAFNILDRAVAVGIDEKQRRGQSRLACSRGCKSCCLNPRLPITSVEFAAITWYAAEKLAGETREKVKGQLARRASSPQCPFLVEGVCAIYPVRPLSCRQFHVFGEPCALTEDVYVTRPKDIWLPGKEIALRVSMKLLPLYGFHSKKQQMKAFDSGVMLELFKEMHTYDLMPIHDAMLSFEQDPTIDIQYVLDPAP